MEAMEAYPKESAVMIVDKTFEDFVEMVRSFHGFAAPGVLIGGFMVDHARRLLPEGRIFDALCETFKCLPDAVQLLTPCTLGNGFLTTVNVGRFALTLYDKETGEGIRIFIDAVKLEEWQEIKAWFYKLKTKQEQDFERLLHEIKTAGADICSIRNVKVASHLRGKKHRGGFAICPQCMESYPIADGALCLACQGEEMYEPSDKGLAPDDRATQERL